MLASNSALIGLLSLPARCLLHPHGVSLSVGAVQLRFVMLGHGVFYLAKALCAAMPGALIDLASFKGQIIQVSLIEGVVAIMLIALSMIGTGRHRREKRIARLAALIEQGDAALYESKRGGRDSLRLKNWTSIETAIT